MNKNIYRISVFEVIGVNAAITTEDGNKVFKRIESAFSNNIPVVLDFKNIDLIVSTFLNAATGQLYSIYDTEFLKRNLKIENISSDDLIVLRKVHERAKEYFRNKEESESTIKNSIDDE